MTTAWKANEANRHAAGFECIVQLERLREGHAGVVDAVEHDCGCRGVLDMVCRRRHGRKSAAIDHRNLRSERSQGRRHIRVMRVKPI